MSTIDIKRIEVELAKVTSARAELELKIMERLEDIERIKLHIQGQLDKELELRNKLKALKGE